jgi:putative glutamine amidotransferase
MLPVIGITSFDEHRNRSAYVSININYPYSVSAAGGLPYALPGPGGLSGDELDGFATAYATSMDGLILSGGGDVCPYLYGEETKRDVARMDADRDRWELALFAAAMARGLPVLAICRGCQVVNVALGGTLWQDIPSQVPSANGHSFDMPMDECSHYIDLVSGTRLHRIFNKQKILTNSFHHQSIKDLAPGLVISARSSDGIIEAVESTDPERFLVAVQFHPEGLTRRYPEFLGLFTALTAAALDFHKAR